MIDYAITTFDCYITEFEIKNRFILLVDEKTGKKQLIKLNTRYSKAYQRKVKKRMKWLIYNYGNRNAVFLTLTLDPKKYNYDTYKMWISIKKELNRFLSALRYYFRKKALSFPKYICTIEAMKGQEKNGFIGKGNPHLHIVFLGCKRIMDWRKLKKLWGLGHIFINRTYQGGKIKYPINYITKYITKTYTNTNTENRLAQSLAWLFNIRSFSTNRGLIYPINPKSKGNWKPMFLIISDKDFDVIKNTFIGDLLNDNPLNPKYKDHWI